MRLLQDLVGQTLSHRYRIVARIAGGGMGEVFRAHDLLLDRSVAVKVLQASLARDPALVARFRQEARAAARLAHPNVVAVHDWGEEDGTYFMVMEYVSGSDARDLLVVNGALMPAQAVEIMIPVMDALAAAHDSGLVHRDIKPENILIDRMGGVKVADFGIAAIGNADQTSPGGIIPGTLRYLSPEQARGHEATVASDIWAAGAVLSELLTGRAPGLGGGGDVLARRAEEQPESPSTYDATIPGDLDEIVLRCCALDPADRFRGASDAAAALRRAAARSLPDAPPVFDLLSEMTGEIRLDDLEPTGHMDRAGRLRLRRRSRRTHIGFVIALLLVVAGAGAALASLLAPKSVEVPELVGLPIAGARLQADEAELGLEVMRFLDSRSEPRGTVLAQFPQDGSLLEGENLRVVVSAGPPRAIVPDLSRLKLRLAEVRLRAAGFRPGGVTTRYAQKPRGTVLAWAPSKGDHRWGAKIELVVSKGPRPVEVPAVLGLARKEAVRALKAAGFEVEIVEVYSNDVKRGLAVATDPATGVAAPQGSTLSLQISLGPKYKKVKLPNVSGMGVDQARAKLEDLGLRVRIVQSEGCAGGSTVRETDPIAGSVVREHDLIALFVC